MHTALIYDPNNASLQSKWLIPQSILSFFLAFFSGFLIHRKRHHVTRGIQLVELSLQVLRDHPSVVGVSVGVLLLFTLFSVTWLALFTRVMLIGHIESETVDGHPVRRWVPEPSSGWLISYFILIYLWTSAIFSYVG